MRLVFGALCLLPAFFACGGDDCHDPDIQGAYAAAEGLWVEHVGQIPEDCLDIPVVTSLASEGDFVGCANESGLVGCTRWQSKPWRYRVEILECRPRAETRETLIHERAHMLRHCITGDGDAGHKDKGIWGIVAPAYRLAPGAPESVRLTL